MTKRFDIDDSDIVVDDLKTGESYIFDDYRSCENCCILLNELHEENMNLRKEKECDKQVFTKKRLHELLQQTRKENEQLKSSDTITDLETEIMNLKTTIQQLTNDNTKQKKKLNTAMKENEHIKQTIKDMIESERTELGKMTLRQLWRQIQ